MNEHVNRHLDGEIPADALDADARREAEGWRRLLEAFRREAPEGTAPPWLEARVMAEIESLGEPGPLRRALEWLLRPRMVPVPPLAAGVVAAALAAWALWPAQEPAAPVGPGAEGAAGAGQAVASTTAGAAGEPVVYVQFRLEAPGARSVAVAGDFSDWEPAYPLDDPDGDGVWTGRVPVRPGVHTYMFVVDGERWLTDPEAERYQDDGFGNRNAVVAVWTGEA